mmetsp:Transcript_156922/g.273144  ORF Transcript_156922/g.273144 Transcript_156922/m.273144 type:complete len:157 (-) Transcript_156922:73-543(-)
MSLRAALCWAALTLAVSLPTSAEIGHHDVAAHGGTAAPEKSLQGKQLRSTGSRGLGLVARERGLYAPPALSGSYHEPPPPNPGWSRDSVSHHMEYRNFPHILNVLTVFTSAIMFIFFILYVVYVFQGDFFVQTFARFRAFQDEANKAVFSNSQFFS